jgi:modulator of FtsH protease
MQSRDVKVIDQNSSLLSTHSVLRNTYLLLSITLIFSASMAYYSVVTNAGYSLLAVLASFAILFGISFMRNSIWGIVGVFAITGLMGYSMGPFLNYFIKGYSNGGQLILTAMAGTGLSFFLCSAYVLTTKKDLSGWGKFLMIGLVIGIVCSLANLFFKMPALQLAVSAAFTLISVMLIMFDTSRIVNNGETNYVMATVSLFIDILMLFQNLLMLLGAFSGNSRD